MKIFVTGASGFIGRAFCNEALKRGHELLCLSRSGKVPGIKSIEVAEGDLGSVPWPQVERFAPEAFLHLAWIATPGEYLESPINGVLAAQSVSVMARLAQLGIPHLASVGTCIEYAPSDTHLSESCSEVAPEFPYSIAKNRLHRWLASAKLPDGITWSWLRIFYPYGPGEHPGRLVSTIATQLLAGKSVHLLTPNSVKDFIFISDLASALCTIFEHKIGGTVNLGTGKGTSIRQLAEIVAESVGVPMTLVQNSDAKTMDSRPLVVADIARIRSAGWEPEVPLNRGVERLINSLESISA